MDSNLTLKNSSEFYLSEDLFLRSIPAKVKVGDLSEDALRLLVYYTTKASPYELAVDSGYFTGTFDDWLESLKAGLTFKTTVATYADLSSLEGMSKGDLVFVKRLGKAYVYADDSFDNEEDGIAITGESAYTLAKNEGFVGSVQDFLISLKGDKGDNGATGPKGDAGVTQDATTILLTNLVTTDNTEIAPTDTLLVALGKLQAQLSALKTTE